MGNLEDSVVDTQGEDNIDRFMYIVKTRLPIILSKIGIGMI